MEQLEAEENIKKRRVERLAEEAKYLEKLKLEEEDGELGGGCVEVFPAQDTS